MSPISPLVVAPGSYPPVGNESFRTRIAAAGQTLRQAGIRTIYLIHGTFVGADPGGLFRAVEAFWPQTGESLRAQFKQAVDALVGQAGNYPADFARLFASSLELPGQPDIAVRTLPWSGENHHLGRAEAAVEILSQLAAEPAEGRVMLWGHSHAGNVLALVSQLLANHASWRETFFHALRTRFRLPLGIGRRRPQWRHVQDALGQSAGPLVGKRFDMVTFGMPIRYDWNPAGCGLLMHFIHHRPQPGLPPTEGPPPESLADLLAARAGDYVQQLGGPGTNLSPSIWDLFTLPANMRLRDLFEPADSLLRLPERLQARRQWSRWGLTELVDYRGLAGERSDECFGHAIYTREECLLFHLEEVARRTAVTAAGPA